MITRNKCTALAIELERTSKALEDLGKRFSDPKEFFNRNPDADLPSSKESAALRRASMDLTRALANLRRRRSY